MDQLPVTQLNYGDSQARYSWIYYTLGQFQCYGKSKPYPNEEKITEFFDDIHENINHLHQWTDKYDPAGYPRFYAMGDNVAIVGGSGYTPLLYNKLDYNLGDGFMKETGVFRTPQGKGLTVRKTLKYKNKSISLAGLYEFIFNLKRDCLEENIKITHIMLNDKNVSAQNL